MTDTIPQPPPDGISPQIREWMINCVRAMEQGDSLDWMLERRVAAIEEVLAARWPRRLLLAGRLGRALRASIAPYAEEGEFLRRRSQAVSVEWLLENARRDRRARTSAARATRPPVRTASLGCEARNCTFKLEFQAGNFKVLALTLKLWT